MSTNRGAFLIALAATVGNFLQGWDNATISGAIVYINRNLGMSTSVEGLIVAMSLIGATAITTCSGAISDMIGRRPMLIASSLLYFVSGLVMFSSPNIFVLCFARLLDGFGIGLAITLVPVYISETSPPEIRGALNTLPQFAGSAGMFLAYIMVFVMSLSNSPSWKLMLGVLSIPSLFYFALMLLFLPESPRWLVSKGKMLEAKKVLQRLRGKEDVSGEMALLVEGLGIGGTKTIEEYIIGPNDELVDNGEETIGKIKLYGPEMGLSWVAKPITGQSSTLARQSMSFIDPVVTLVSKLSGQGSTIFPNFGSMVSPTHHEIKHEEWDEENVLREGEDCISEGSDDLHSPLISRQTISLEKDIITPISNGEVVSSMGIGGGWQLAWKFSEREGGEDGNKEGEFKRIYLHEEGTSKKGSTKSLLEGEFVQAAALVSQPALGFKEHMDQQHLACPAMVHPAETVSKSPIWAALSDPGILRALMVGIGIQVLQQFSGINGVMYYTPQILEEAGVEVLLANLGLTSESASFLISCFTTLMMLPCIVVAMRLMDLSGRRMLLLTTLPVLIVTLLVLVFSQIVSLGKMVNAGISTSCVIIYFCCFVMGYGPIPNILCSEIFPTRVRGICIAICSLVYWVCDIIVTYTLPVMLSSIGLAGIFSIYAIVCVISWIFVYMKVPETKGMPLEVITEFFSVGAGQQQRMSD